MVLEKLTVILRKALVAQGLFADEVKSDRPQPFAEIGPCLEVHDMAVGKDKGLVGDLVDEVGHGQFHGDKGPQVRTMEVEESLEGAQISLLHTNDEVVFIYRLAHDPLQTKCSF